MLELFLLFFEINDDDDEDEEGAEEEEEEPVVRISCSFAAGELVGGRSIELLVVLWKVTTSIPVVPSFS